MLKNKGVLKNTALPSRAYTDVQWFELEMKVRFSRTWTYGGLTEDLTGPGQFKCVQAGLNNIIIVMGRDRRLRAFHNICRHRGTPLLQATGQVKTALTCPYHDWTYDLEGNLLSVPNQEQEFPEMDKTCLGLKPASVDCWRGMIWVHPDSEPELITEWFADVIPHLGPHKPEQLVESTEHRVVEEIRANLKIVVENYIDHYHLAQLHAGTLNMYDHRQAVFGFHGPHFAFREPLEKEYGEKIDSQSSMPLIDHIPKAELGAWVPMLFPGIGLGESESAWSVFHIQPLAADRTRVEIRTKVMNVPSTQFLSQSVRSLAFWGGRITPKYSDAPAGQPLASADFIQEDIFVCEQQQKSFSSPYYEPEPSALFGESPVREHQKWIMKYLGPYLSEMDNKPEGSE